MLRNVGVTSVTIGGEDDSKDESKSKERRRTLVWKDTAFSGDEENTVVGLMMV
jgi:hypothetical protein